MTRIPALDRLRGVLALLVVLDHEALAIDKNTFVFMAGLCVLAFFSLSGYVLALTYDGRPVAFLVRRFVRLWPAYALSVMAGFVLLSQPPDVGLLFWCPNSYWTIFSVNSPGWSLFIEMWASPVLLVMFWIAHRGRVAANAMIVFTASLVLVACFWPLWRFNLAFAVIALAFTLGVVATRYNIRWSSATPQWSMWLGKISYSLYISHWVVIHAVVRWLGPAWIPATIPLVFLVAWAMWRWVEQPSVRLSRWISAPRLRAIGQNPDTATVSASERI